MAIIKITPVKRNVGTTIKYVTNDEKAVVDIPEGSEMKLVTGINCSVNNAKEEMNVIKQFYSKTKKAYKARSKNDPNAAKYIESYHIVQSFGKNSVDPFTAHQVGTEFAKEMWGNDFQIVVSTHTDTDTVHNHIIINSVSFADGHKYNYKKRDLIHAREISDRICKEHGLDIISDKKGVYQPYNEYFKQKNNDLTRRNIIKYYLDEIIQRSFSINQFKNLIGYYGFEINYSNNLITHPGLKYGCTLDSIGEDYTPEKMTYRILHGPHKTPDKSYQKKIKLNRYDKSHNLRTLIEYVSFLDFVLKHENNFRKIILYCFEDLLKLDKLKNLAEKARNVFHFRSTDDVSVMYTELNHTISVKEEQRKKLRYKEDVARKKNNPEDKEKYNREKKDLSKEISELKKKRKDLEAITEFTTLAEEAVQKLNEVQFPTITHNHDRNNTDIEIR